MKYSVVASFIIASYFFSIAHGYTPEATTTLLTLEPNARSYGMGGVGAAMTGGPQTSFYNPAAIGGIRHFSLEGSRFDLGYPNLGFTNLSAGYNLGENGTVAISFTEVGLGTSIRTDEFGDIVSESSPNELAISGSYSIELSPNFYVGTSVKYITSDHSPFFSKTAEANALAFDLGVLVDNLLPSVSYVNYGKQNSNSFNHQAKGFSIGAAVLNLGPDIKYKDTEQKDPLPRLLRMGIAWKPIVTEMFQTTLAADYEKSLVGGNSSFFKEFFDPAFFISKYGLEVNFFYVWTFRLGYRQDNENEDHYRTTGFGFGPHWINVNIASHRGGKSRYSVIFNYPLDLK